LLTLKDYTLLAGKNPRAADRAVTALIAAVESLNHFPERGRSASLRHTRELIVPFGQSNYVIRYTYRHGADEVVVFRIWHGREARD